MISTLLYFVVESPGPASNRALSFELDLVGLSIALTEYYGLWLPESPVLKEAQDSSCITVPRGRNFFSE